MKVVSRNQPDKLSHRQMIKAWAARWVEKENAKKRNPKNNIHETDNMDYSGPGLSGSGLRKLRKQ